MAIRSFLAFELPPEIKEMLRDVSGEMKKLALDLRWVKVDNMHLTVVFLGGINRAQIGEVGLKTEEICCDFAPFNVSLRGTGIFGTPRNPRVLWIGINGDLDRMGRFRDSLQLALEDLGVRQEKRPFRPHLTVGRFRKGSRTASHHLEKLLSRYRDLKSQPWPAKELVLFRSDLNPGGAVYTKMKAWPLTGQG